MERFMRRPKEKPVSMEEAFNWSFEILKSNMKTLFPALVILIILKIGSRMFFNKEDTFFWNMLLISYSGFSGFISTIIYAGLRVEISDYIENGKKMTSLFTSGKKLWQRIIFISLLYFTFLFILGVFISIYLLFLTMIGHLSLFIAVFLGIAAFISGVAALVYFKIRTAFFQNIYYVRKLGVIKSFLYSFHVTKGYFSKIFLTDIIFWFMILILEIMLTFSSFINFFSKNIWLIIVTVIVQSIICFVILFLINTKVCVISLFYLDAEHNDLQSAEKNNKTIE